MPSPSFRFPSPLPAGNGASRVAVLAGLCLLLFLLYSANNDFPLGYHADEFKKLDFILTGKQDFYHPLLMLDIMRAINTIAGIRDLQALVELGRLTSAIGGVLIVLFTYLFARGWLSHPAAIAAAALTGVTPILAVHSHYLKEDILLTAGCMLALTALQHYVGRPSASRAAVLGIALGIAVSAKYTALLLFPVLLVVPLLHRQLDWRAYFTRLAPAGLAAVLVFLLLNYPLFGHWQQFVDGFTFEKEHWIEGHDTRIDPLVHRFGFHLVNSLAPGMTIPLLSLGLLGLAASVYRWRRIPWQQRLAVLFALGGYAVFELSPLKPFPGYMRYVLPLVPLLACLTVAFTAEAAAHFTSRPRRAAAWLVPVLAGGVALLDSVLLVYHLDRDTRAAAESILLRNGQRPFYEWYAANGWLGQTKSLGQLSPTDLRAIRASGRFDVLVASSLMYGRYEYAGKLPGQPDEVYRTLAGYQALFAQPMVEVKPAYKSFAFSNPTIRIVELP